MRRVLRHGAQQVDQRDVVLVVQADQRRQQGLQTERAGRRFRERQALVFGWFRRVVGDDNVDQAGRDGIDEGQAVAFGAQGRIETEEGAVVADVDLVEHQVVDRGRGEDLKTLGLGAFQRFQAFAGRHLIDEEARAGHFGQGEVALDHDAFGQGRDTGKPHARRHFAGGGHGAFGKPGFLRAVGDQGVEAVGIVQHAAEDLGIDDRLIGIGEIERTGLGHQADFRHLFALQLLGGGAGGIDVDQFDIAGAAQDEIGHGRFVDARIGVGLDDEGGNAPGGGGQAGGFQGLGGFVTGFAGLDAHVDQAGQEGVFVAVDNADAGGQGRGTVAQGDIGDDAIRDDDRAGAVIFGGRVDQAGIDEGNGGGFFGHRVRPQL